MNIGRIRKAIAGIVGAIIGVGGVAVLLSNLPPQWQTVITGVVTILAVLVGPANDPKPQIGRVD